MQTIPIQVNKKKTVIYFSNQCYTILYWM